VSPKEPLHGKKLKTTAQTVVSKQLNVNGCLMALFALPPNKASALSRLVSDSEPLRACPGV